MRSTLRMAPPCGALRHTDGSRRWPPWTSRSVVIGGFDGYVYCLYALTGDMRWKFLTGDGNAIWASPAIAGGLVFIGAPDARMRALNLTSGALVWSLATGGAIFSSAEVGSNGVVYWGCDDGGVYGANASTGALLFNFSTPFAAGHFSSPVITAEGLLLIGDDNSTMWALSG